MLFPCYYQHLWFLFPRYRLNGILRRHLYRSIYCPRPGFGELKPSKGLRPVSPTYVQYFRYLLEWYLRRQCPLIRWRNVRKWCLGEYGPCLYRSFQNLLDELRVLFINGVKSLIIFLGLFIFYFLSFLFRQFFRWFFCHFFILYIILGPLYLYFLKLLFTLKEKLVEPFPFFYHESWRSLLSQWSSYYTYP